VYDAERARAAGIDVTRRPTGGLAVLHDRELTYSVSAPLHRFGGPRAAYTAINRALVEGLRALGVPAALATGGPPRGPAMATAEPCFQVAAPGEVVTGGRKLIGSAQRAEGGALLQHGSILLDGTQATVVSLLTVSDGALLLEAADRPGRRSFSIPAMNGFTTVREVLGSVPSWEDLVQAFVAGFEAVCGTRLAPDQLSRDEISRASAWEDHYRGATWTWRR
jgi:lipoyl(octanoyl) transferase